MKIYCLEIRDRKLPKSIKPVYHFYNILYNIDRRKGRNVVGNKKKEERRKIKELWFINRGKFKVNRQGSSVLT